MRIQQMENRILRNDNQRRTILHGPHQTCRDTRLADSLYGETSLLVFRIWKFLLKIHLSLLRHCQTLK